MLALVFIARLVLLLIAHGQNYDTTEDGKARGGREEKGAEIRDGYSYFVR